MQSILLSVAVVVIYFVLFFLSMVLPFLWIIDWIIYLGVFAIWILMLVKAYQGEKYKLPIIGQMAENYSNK